MHFLQKYLTTIISVLATAVLIFVWLINGAELEDAWLYIVGITIVILPALESYFKQRNG